MARSKRRRQGTKAKLALKRLVMMPRYLLRFKCLGSACEDVCCIGWRVGVDAATFARYQRVVDPEMRLALQAGMELNPADQRRAEDFATMKLNERGECVFLSSERLCTIQLKLGEAFLSTTCASYPRVQNLIDGSTCERAAQLSCPEIARLALLAHDAMEVVEVEEPQPQRIPTNKVATATLPPEHPQHHFQLMRREVVRLLQRRDVSLETRLIALGFALRKLAESPSVERKLIAETFQYYFGTLAELEQQLERLVPNRTLQMSLLRQLTEERFRVSITSERYRSCVERMVKGLGTDPEQEGRTPQQAYEAALHDYLLPFLGRYPYALENLLVNHVLVSLFPFTPDRTLFEDYVIFIVRYALIKLHLVGAAACERRLTEELFIETIQSFERAIEHNIDYIELMLKMLRELNMISMAHMAILVVS